MAEFDLVERMAAPLLLVGDADRRAAVTALCTAAVRLQAPVDDLRLVLDAAGLS